MRYVPTHVPKTKLSNPLVPPVAGAAKFRLAAVINTSHLSTEHACMERDGNLSANTVQMLQSTFIWCAHRVHNLLQSVLACRCMLGTYEQSTHKVSAYRRFRAPTPQTARMDDAKKSKPKKECKASSRVGRQHGVLPVACMYSKCLHNRVQTTGKQTYHRARCPSSRTCSRGYADQTSADCGKLHIHQD